MIIFPSSKEIIPSFPIFSKALAIISPVSRSLPAEIEAPAEKETESKADDEKDHCSDNGVDDKGEQSIGDVDIAMVSPDNVADVDKEAGLFFL